jgi:RHS repeat-associated protein
MWEYNEQLQHMDFRLPNTLLLINLTNSNTNMYILQTELNIITEPYTIVESYYLDERTNQFAFTMTDGSIGYFSIEEILGLIGMVPEGFTLTSGVIDPFTTPLTVPTTVHEPDFHYYIYDHLGNTRIVYSTTIPSCGNPEYTLEAVMDYFPYGKILRQFIKTPEKYVTTGHERDVETGLDYRGARFYDSDVARFLSLDPHAADYPSLSDYSYVAGNPVMIVDTDGKDNIMYLVILDDAADGEGIMNELQAMYDNLGINIKVHIITNELQNIFHKDHIDATDGIAVYGDRDDVVDYIKKHGGSEKFTKNLDGFFEGKYFGSDEEWIEINGSKWEGDNNPEITNEGFVAVNQDAIKNKASSLAKTTVNKYAAYTILHGTGHLRLGSGHPSGSHFFMEGNLMQLFLTRDKGKLFHLYDKDNPKAKEIVDKINKTLSPITPEVNWLIEREKKVNVLSGTRATINFDGND